MTPVKFIAIVTRKGVLKYANVVFETTERSLVVHLGANVAGHQVKVSVPWASVVSYTTTGES